MCEAIGEECEGCEEIREAVSMREGVLMRRRRVKCKKVSWEVEGKMGWRYKSVCW